MKKLLAILVVFTMVVGAVSAVDLGGTVFGHVEVVKGSSASGSDLEADGGMDRLRLEGSGAAGDEFGGWLRAEAGGFNGLAWWKPIDEFKLTIGGNPDGFYGKEGVTGWMFNQMPYDSGIAAGSSNIWGWGETVSGLQTRFAFFGGFGGQGALLEIKPVDMIGINVVIPYMSGGTVYDVYKNTIAQLDINLDFGNIAFTYDGGAPFGGAIFAYFGGNFGDLSLDVGVSFAFDTAMFAGLGLKFATDSFGIKFRTAVQLPIDDGQNLGMLFDILPYVAISDSMSAFLNAGVGISGADSDIGWFVNPYLRVGAEWGPTFYFGIKVAPAGDDISFSVPISLMVSF